MKKKYILFVSYLSMIVLLEYLFGTVRVESAFLYKSYIVRQDRGIDILCDPYVVQKNDWILKVFRQKGEIAHRDFPEFLNIFSRLNSHIQNIDLIRPGQQIFIPLKRLSPDSLPGQSSGIVTIPFVTILSTSQLLTKHSVGYKVKKGDCVSKIISQNFAPVGTKSYNDGIKLFKHLNPEIRNLNRIYAGKQVNIPDPSVQNQGWYQSIFDDSGNIKVGLDDSRHLDATGTENFIRQEVREKKKSVLSEAASILGAKFIDKGKYHFPGKEGDDFELNLSQFPVIELQDGTRIICSGDKELKDNEKKVIKSYWGKIEYASIPEKESPEKAFNSVFEAAGKKKLKNSFSFSDNGMDILIRADWIIDKPAEKDGAILKTCIFLMANQNEKTPDSIIYYLAGKHIIVKDIFKKKQPAVSVPKEKNGAEMIEDTLFIQLSDRKTFVMDLFAATGYKYIQNVHITFPYSGIQVKAVSNYISSKNGSPMLVDFGEFYGDAIPALKKSGFGMVQIKKEDDFITITEKLFKDTALNLSKNPVFLAAKRPEKSNIALRIPGFLLTNQQNSKIFLGFDTVDNGIIQFLKKQNLKVILFKKQAETQQQKQSTKQPGTAEEN